MTHEEINTFAETLHQLNYGTGKPQRKLVFHHGDFISMGSEEQEGKGLVVTDMSREGFAASVPAHDVPPDIRKPSEVDILWGSRALIIGLGSFGSHIAVTLAEAGVGNFALMDFDKVEEHNILRHVATYDDLFLMKTDVVERVIHGKRPSAKVDKYPVDATKEPDLLREEILKADIVICATDNNASRFRIAKVLSETKKVGIFGRAFSRAEGGDVLRARPDGPCYCCQIGDGNDIEEELTNVASARRNGRIPAYVSDEDAEAQIHAGLSLDIIPIWSLMVRLALVELIRRKASPPALVEEDFPYDYYIWANRREKIFTNWLPLDSGDNPTIMRWYGGRIPKNEYCPICGTRIELETDDNLGFKASL